MFTRFFTWIGLAVLCSVVIKIMLMLDLNKKIYNHQPGQCKYVSGIDSGSEDLELLSDGNVIISSGLRYIPSPELKAVKGRIFLYNLGQEPANYRATELRIEGELDKESFNPHGITTFNSKGRITLYVVNHLPSEDVVECFTYNKDRKSLTHTKTIRNPYFYSLNDLVAVGPDRFYATNDHYFRNYWIRALETLLMLNTGNVVYFDGKAWTSLKTAETAVKTEAKAMDSWIQTPNGVAISKDNKHLYVAQPMQESIRIYNISRDQSLVQQADMTLLTSPDNIFVDPENGELWTGAHPVAHQVSAHIHHPKTVPAPSQVLHIRVQGSHDRWVVTEPFASDGVTGNTPLWASTSAIFYKSQLLIGTVAHKLLHCPVLNPELA